MFMSLILYSQYCTIKLISILLTFKHFTISSFPFNRTTYFKFGATNLIIIFGEICLTVVYVSNLLFFIEIRLITEAFFSDLAEILIKLHSILRNEKPGLLCDKKIMACIKGVVGIHTNILKYKSDFFH